MQICIGDSNKQSLKSVMDPHILSLSIFYTLYILYSWKTFWKLCFNRIQLVIHPLFPRSISLLCFKFRSLWPVFVPFFSLFTWGAICHQQSPRVGGGNGRSATGTPWDTAAAWREHRFRPWCRRWSWEWTRPSEGCCSRSPPGQCRGMGPSQRLCETHRALEVAEWD